MSDGSILTYTSEGIFRTMDVTVSHGEYVAIFEGIGSDILKGESLRVRTLYQGSVSNEVNPVKTTDWTDDYAPVSTPAPTVKTDTTTMGERNAAQKALDYLRFAAFSREGLIEQLEFEGFSHEEAVYGVDQSGADWNEQAALKAQSYLDYSSFSREGLIEQLVFEGFTRQQAEYGVQAVGY
ncbi:MAG: hypothetical protein D5R96_09125 [Methanocalculus sp. MSAO_Arc2]|nr:MAG: hypothetical protein D5R96_09125 [Methanocalculus sp. MSAO_Arc2]